MGWIYVGIAGLLEVCFVVALSAARGLHRPIELLPALALGISSFVVLSKALEVLPIGPAYAVWTGIGVIGAAATGAVIWGESLSLSRGLWMTWILVGIVGLYLATEPRS